MISKDTKVNGNIRKDLRLFMLLLISGVFLSTSLLYADDDIVGNKKFDFKSQILNFSTLIASGDNRITELVKKCEIPKIDDLKVNSSMFRGELLDYSLDAFISLSSNSSMLYKGMLEIIADKENLHEIMSRILRNNSGTIKTILFDSIPISFDVSIAENFENIKDYAKNYSLTPLEYKSGWDMQNLNDCIILSDSIVYNVISIMATWDKYLAQQDKDLVITIEVDKEVYNPDENGEASIAVLNTGESITGDFLLALIDPNTNIYFYPEWLGNTRIFPVQIPANFKLDKTTFIEFKMPNMIPPIEKPGQYIFAGGLSTTGTFDFISTGAFDFTANTPPNAPYSPNGPSKGWINTPYTFKTLSIDESHDSLSIRFDWGDGTLSDWTEFIESGKPLSMVHSFNTTGIFDIRAMAQDVWNAQSIWSDALQIAIINTLPPETPTLEGPTEGQILKEYFFKVKTTDPDGDMISYKVDWGDGATDGWSEYVNSGDIKYFSHIWGDSNSFLITVYAKDTNGVEASFPSRNMITIYKNRAPYFSRSPAGPPNGQLNTAYTFTTTAVDLEDDNISYKFNWGDGEISDWSDPQKSGTEYSATHSYNTFALFEIIAYAKDTKGLISEKSIGHNILISSNKLPYFLDNRKPMGPTTGGVGVEYEFEISPTDPEKTPLSVKFVWGDGSETEWSQLQPSGSLFTNTHVYHETGEYKIFCFAKDSDGIVSLPSLSALIKIYGPANQAPFFTEPPIGPDTTTVNTKEVFYTSAIDPEGDMIQFKFYWTNEVTSEWTEFIPSGDTIARSHAWTDVSTVDIKAFARDDKGNVAQSNAHTITVAAE